MVTRLFEWYATGKYTLKQVTEMACSEGLVFRKSKAPIPRATVHQMLRNRVYTGDFDWDGKTYRGVHVPLVSRELWERVQGILGGRAQNRNRRARHDFPFSRLITCGHCGCSFVGELKKGRYVYYHCTGYKGKCPEPYTRQEVLEEKFSRVLKTLVFDDEVMAWVAEALRQSHGDERRYHDEAIARLQAEYNRLQNRIDTMYADRLDGRVQADFFDHKAKEWRAEQARLLGVIQDHQTANQSYLEDGIQLLELARRAHTLFEKQEPSSKRRLLDFVLSNSTWRDGELTATFRQPFDAIAAAATATDEKTASGVSSDDRFVNWLPALDSN
jgi:hypothetical protein